MCLWVARLTPFLPPLRTFPRFLEFLKALSHALPKSALSLFIPPPSPLTPLISTHPPALGTTSSLSFLSSQRGEECVRDGEERCVIVTRGGKTGGRCRWTLGWMHGWRYGTGGARRTVRCFHGEGEEGAEREVCKDALWAFYGEEEGRYCQASERELEWGL